MEIKHELNNDQDELAIGCGVEIPVNYKCFRPDKAINWIQKYVNKTINDLLMKTVHYMS